MSTTDNGGPAFPETRWDDKTRQEVQWTGMTLRDYFAAKAMQGLMSDPRTTVDISGDYIFQQRAKSCYIIADAMLKAREENP
jgi:hypothetical protein